MDTSETQSETFLKLSASLYGTGLDMWPGWQTADGRHEQLLGHPEYRHETEEDKRPAGETTSVIISATGTEWHKPEVCGGYGGRPMSVANQEFTNHRLLRMQPLWLCMCFHSASTYVTWQRHIDIKIFQEFLTKIKFLDFFLFWWSILARFLGLVPYPNQTHSSWP